MAVGENVLRICTCRFIKDVMFVGYCYIVRKRYEKSWPQDSVGVSFVQMYMHSVFYPQTKWDCFDTM